MNNSSFLLNIVGFMCSLYALSSCDKKAANEITFIPVKSKDLKGVFLNQNRVSVSKIIPMRYSYDYDEHEEGLKQYFSTSLPSLSLEGGTANPVTYLYFRSDDTLQKISIVYLLDIPNSSALKSKAFFKIMTHFNINRVYEDTGFYKYTYRADTLPPFSHVFFTMECKDYTN